MPQVKELDFFDAPREQFESSLDWYRSYFRGVDEPLSGEATPLYFRRPDVVPERMQQVYGDAPPRFLLLLRDPMHRAYSHYLHKVSQGTEPLSFEEALTAEQKHPERKRREWKSYFQDGRYDERLTAWLDVFPSERFLILLSQNLRQSPKATLRKTFQFLGVDPTAEIDTSVHLNCTAEQRSRLLGTFLSILPSWLPPIARKWTPESARLWIEQLVRVGAADSQDRPSLDPRIERTLRKRYAPHVRRLSDLIDRDLTDWLPKSTD